MLVNHREEICAHRNHSFRIPKTGQFYGFIARRMVRSFSGAQDFLFPHIHHLRPHALVSHLVHTNKRSHCVFLVFSNLSIWKGTWHKLSATTHPTVTRIPVPLAPSSVASHSTPYHFQGSHAQCSYRMLSFSLPVAEPSVPSPHLVCSHWSAVILMNRNLKCENTIFNFFWAFILNSYSLLSPLELLNERYYSPHPVKLHAAFEDVGYVPEPNKISSQIVGSSLISLPWP